MQNNLVDSLEFLSAFALLSGMTPEEKISCMFHHHHLFLLLANMHCSYFCNVRFR
jgi:hypothetical protein